MKINVHHVAKLANLSITKDEEEKFERQLSEVLSYVDKLKEVDTKDSVTTSQVTGLENILRTDVTDASLSQEETLSQSPATHNHMFQVKGVFEE